MQVDQDENIEAGSKKKPMPSDEKPKAEKPVVGARSARRKIGGDLAYNTTPGGLEKTLKAIITAQKPDKVDTKYIQTTLSVTGGTGANQLGTLKKLGIVSSSGEPTKIYDDFRNDNLRSYAAFQMLKNGYGSIFKVNAHAHKAGEDEIQNIIAQVTGLDKGDSLIRTMYNCFDKVRGFIDPNINVYEEPQDTKKSAIKPEEKASGGTKEAHPHGVVGTLGLNYQINIVLPQSGNIETYDMIFQSLRNNLLDWNK